jgi:hypothetical protein
MLEYLQNFRKFENSRVILLSEGFKIYTEYNDSEVDRELTVRTYIVQCAVKACNHQATICGI